MPDTEEGAKRNRGCVFLREVLDEKRHKVKEKVVPFFGGGKKGTSIKGIETLQ